MMSFMYYLLGDEDFRGKIIAAIAAQVGTRSVTCYDSHDGELEGDVSDYSLDDVQFSDFEAEGVVVTVRVTGNGVATAVYKNSDGDYGEDEIEGPFEGNVTLEFSLDILVQDKMLQIVEDMEVVEVDIQSISLRARA